MRRHIVPDVVNDQEIAALSKSATVRDAARLMRERSISAVLVMEGDALEGIFTVRDVARRIDLFSGTRRAPRRSNWWAV